MTVTETRPESLEEAAAAGAVGALPSGPAPLLPPAPPEGFAGVLATAEHKVVGRLYIGFSLLFLLGGLVLAELVAVEGVDLQTLNVLDADTYFQILTLSQVGVFFLGLMPLLLGVAIHVVPLQVGSATIAFPRAAAASFWTWLVGALLLVAGYGINGGPGGGDPEAVHLTLAAWGMVLAALLLGVICVVTTVLTARPEGMSLKRAPAFAWSMVAGGSVWLLALPVLGANLALVYLDDAHSRILFGQADNVWPQLSWVFASTAVFSFAVPVLGVAADVIPVMAGRRQARYPVGLGLIAAFAVVGFGAHHQTFFNPRLVEQGAFVGASFALLLVLLAFLGGLGDVLRRGRPRIASPLMLAMPAVLLLLGAAAAAAAYSVRGFKLFGTTWGLGVTKLVVGAIVLGAAAALHYWGPKVWGRMPAEPLGRLNALVLLGGAVLYGGSDLVSGAIGQPTTPVTGVATVVEDGAELLNGLGAVGGALLIFGVLLLIVAHLPAAFGQGRRAAADPWGGFTLEWATASPPPHGNFIEPLPAIGSPYPLLDARDATAPAIDALGARSEVV
ncbi:MAG: cbb3-type cytochrome c oxidase subunit I [Acidimicrobiales bacterium]